MNIFGITEFIKFTRGKKTRRINAQNIAPLSTTAVILALTVLSILVISVAYAQVITPSVKGCNGNLICDKQLSCDLSTQTCTPIFSNCQGCGTSTVSCAGGKTVFASKVCREDAGGATCMPDPNACSATTGIIVNEPNIVLRFNVFTPGDIIVTIDPASVTALPGTLMNYKLSVDNRNNQRFTFTAAADAPVGWNVTIASQLIVNANSKKEIQFSVRSPSDATNNAYRIIIALIEPNFNIFLSKDAEYVIGNRGAPSVEVTPASQEAIPGDTRTYQISVKNNDPPGFDASTIFLRPLVPSGWRGTVTPTSVSLAPGETGTATLDATSPKNITTNELEYLVGVNATANTLTAVGFSSYILNYCGDGVCAVGEENTCSADCPSDSVFKCDRLSGGRCEEEVDDGVHFASTVNMLVNKFIICNRRFTQAQCEAAYDARQCGLDKACLCGDRLGETECSTRCIDSKGFYYLYARGGTTTARSIANYTYACPWVDLPNFMALRADFADSLENYEQAYSGLLETVNNPDASEQTRARYQPCVDAHAKIISDINAHIAYMDAVILNPAKSNTTQARERSVALKNNIDQLLNQFCSLGVSGLLRIDKIEPPPLTEINNNATGSVTIKNIGTLTYYGFASCDFSLGSNRKQVNTTCKPYNQGESSTEPLTIMANAVGTWSLTCTSYGSFNQDCSQASVHSIASSEFDTYTKDVFVVSVDGTCTDEGIQCTVRTTSPKACAACRIDKLDNTSIQCSSVSQVNKTTTFSCPRQLGNNTLTGYVVSSADCNPISPTQKRISVYCPGCGSGKIDPGETCELPNTDNNTYVVQKSGLNCDVKRSFFLDRYGFCTPTCQGSNDQPVSVCIKNSCYAQCGEGETRTVVINGTGNASCRATQQCGEQCEFINATCDPRLPGENQTTNGNGTLSLTTEHYPAEPTTNTTVRITGFTDASNVRIEIFLDNTSIKICGISQCDYITKINRIGVHTYYATAATATNSVRDPKTGMKSFVVFPASGNFSRVCSISLTSSSCSYDATRNIYNISASATWNALLGDHAHLGIAGETGMQKLYTSQIFASRIVGAGVQNVRAEVHDLSDNIVCADEQDVICGQGTSTSGKVSVVRELADVVRVGDVPVKFKILANADVTLTFTEHVPAGLSVKDLKLANQTASDVTVSKNATVGSSVYDTYKWTRTMKKTDVIEFSYVVNLPQERDYTFRSIAAFGSEQQNESFTTYATKCSQLGKVYAVSPNNNCQSFRTSCDVFPGWTIVAECPSVGEPEPTEGIGLIALLPIIIVIVLLGLGYVYRDKIREKLEEWRAGGIVKKMRKIEYRG